MAIPVVSPESTAAIADLIRLREQFVKERLIFVESTRMIPILKLLGATDEDMEKIKTVSNSLPDDPTLPFRKSKNARFCFDFEQSKVRRLEFQPFILSADEDFVRHDSGQRPKLNYETEKFVCTLFNLRTVTSPDILGEPALEGVHSDGVDFTMTTFLGSENMSSDSATTFVHDMRAKNALRWNEVNPEHTLGSHQHREFLDTLLFVDHERKHSLSPVHAVDPSCPATRDMLIFFTRKPVVEGHPSHPFDSLNSHISLPMEVGLA
ncbi:hypothetical protein MGYG_06885 [Nannizzia gypsea CBS 118893]|uniref:2OG-Fe dioxygenase-domain-containing protein n=1 Tax=Arthroderma gypseum (strain ATCC MYA-4604 / CBS 118893) TaxID=535722 RepID=E4V1H2_ARTGP|nr:hypothetical protein MGYG_06885 [Nannizzia gypsea CBS 118893]EFR03887.1 hypothetical protein MGYG_06885 [Nannizzia gypsea CBS 118893]